LFAKRILKNPGNFEDTNKILLIDAIQKIRELYLPEFKDYFEDEQTFFIAFIVFVKKKGLEFLK